MRDKSSKRGPSQRQLRVGELLRKDLADIFIRSEIQDPELDGVTFSVVEVSVSPDMRSATAFVIPLGESEPEVLVKALQRHSKYVRGVVAKKIQLKYMPELKFKLDETLDEAGRIDDILRSPEVSPDLEKDQ